MTTGKYGEYEISLNQSNPDNSDWKVRLSIADVFYSKAVDGDNTYRVRICDKYIAKCGEAFRYYPGSGSVVWNDLSIIRVADIQPPMSQ